MPGSENSIALMFYYVYVLQSMKNNQLYIGYTTYLRKRLQEHNRGLNFSTKPYKPWQVIHYEAYRNEKMPSEEKDILKRAKVVDYSNAC